jgi:hypothetical protein
MNEKLRSHRQVIKHLKRFISQPFKIYKSWNYTEVSKALLLSLTKVERRRDSQSNQTVLKQSFQCYVGTCISWIHTQCQGVHLAARWAMPGRTCLLPSDRCTYYTKTEFPARHPLPPCSMMDCSDAPGAPGMGSSELTVGAPGLPCMVTCSAVAA